MNLLKLKLTDGETKNLLWTNERASDESRFILKSVDYSNDSTLYFQSVPSTEIKPSIAKRWWIATRAFSLTAVIAPAVVTYLSGIWISHYPAQPLVFISLCLALVFLQIAVNLLNDVNDHLALVDLPGDPGGSGVIQKDWLSARALFRAGLFCVLLSLALGLPTLIAHAKILFPLGGLALLGALGYSGIGFRFKYRALGDLAVFILCGPLLVFGLSIALFSEISSSAWLIGTVFGLAAVAILHANNLHDLEIDKMRGARTVANQLGFKASQRYLGLIFVLLAASLLLSAVFTAIPLWFCLTPFAAIFLVWPLLKQVKLATSPLSPVISKIRIEAAQAHLAIGGLWIAGLLLKRICYP